MKRPDPSTGGSRKVDAGPTAWQLLARLSRADTPRSHRIADGSVPTQAEGYDLLRTQMLVATTARDWTCLAIAQAGPSGAAAAVTAVNLALSEARRPHRKVVLADLDAVAQPVSHLLRVAPPLPPSPTPPAGPTLLCHAVNDRLALLRIAAHRDEAAVTLLSPDFHRQLDGAMDDLTPDIILLHLPPLLSGDAGLAGLDLAQAVLLVIDGRADTAERIRTAQARIAARCPVIGIFLHDAEA